MAEIYVQYKYNSYNMNIIIDTIILPMYQLLYWWHKIKIEIKILYYIIICLNTNTNGILILEDVL